VIRERLRHRAGREFDDRDRLYFRPFIDFAWTQVGASFDRVTPFGPARTSEVLRSPPITSQNPHRLLSSTPFQCSLGNVG
jgi:hypothetical protein